MTGQSMQSTVTYYLTRTSKSLEISLSLYQAMPYCFTGFVVDSTCTLSYHPLLNEMY